MNPRPPRYEPFLGGVKRGGRRFEDIPRYQDLEILQVLFCAWGLLGLYRGYVGFNGRLRDELLNRELFLSIDELRYVVDRWQMNYNHYRPHSSLDYMAPAAFAATCQSSDSATPHPKIEVRDDEKILS